MAEGVTEIIATYKGENFTVLIDTEDLELVSSYKWHIDNYGYAVHSVWKKDVNLPKIRMHRLILGIEDQRKVDHANGNPSDNRKCNLRICTQAENLRNKRKQQYTRGAASSKYKGVYWAKDHDKWRVRVNLNGKSTHVGLFIDEKEAALAYNAKALELHGIYAKLNEIN